MGVSHREQRLAQSQQWMSDNEEQISPFAWFQTRAGAARGPWVQAR